MEPKRIPYNAGVSQLPPRSSKASGRRTHFLCRACGSVQAKWMGKCPDCGTWDGLERYVEPAAEREDFAAAAWLPASTDGGEDSGGAGSGEGPSSRARASGSGGARQARSAGALPIAEIPLDDVPRVRTGVSEFDRVLGGGIVPGSVILLGGDPGIGKSTLLLQALASLAGRSSEDPRAILYVSSEESARQVRLRAERLLPEDPEGRVGARSAARIESGGPAPQVSASGLGQPDRAAAAPAGADITDGGAPRQPPFRRLHVLAETNLALIGEQIRRLRPALCAIDSIQMIYRPDVPAAAGSVGQVRRCCADLISLAKRSGMPVIVVGHVTKDGQLAGPKLLEHLVDVVLSFEGDRHHGHRVVRAIKNRFGSTHEIGLFEMTGAGLRELDDGLAGPDPHRAPLVGTAICPAILGSRCLLAEVEALTATGVLGNARRKVTGLDASRLAMLIAVLEKHGGLRLADQDVFASAAGGLRATEPAMDLAVALAIAGAHYRRAVPPASAIIGEVGLTGLVRSVPQVQVRIREALRRGFKRIVVPQEVVEQGLPGEWWEVVVPVRSLTAALALLAPIGPGGEPEFGPARRSGERSVDVGTSCDSAFDRDQTQRLGPSVAGVSRRDGTVRGGESEGKRSHRPP